MLREWRSTRCNNSIFTRFLSQNRVKAYLVALKRRTVFLFWECAVNAPVFDNNQQWELSGATASGWKCSKRETAQRCTAPGHCGSNHPATPWVKSRSYSPCAAIYIENTQHGGATNALKCSCEVCQVTPGGHHELELQRANKKNDTIFYESGDTGRFLHPKVLPKPNRKKTKIKPSTTFLRKKIYIAFGKKGGENTVVSSRFWFVTAKSRGTPLWQIKCTLFQRTPISRKIKFKSVPRTV